LVTDLPDPLRVSIPTLQQKDQPNLNALVTSMAALSLVIRVTLVTRHHVIVKVIIYFLLPD
jgi:hypothetical protein